MQSENQRDQRAAERVAVAPLLVNRQEAAALLSISERKLWELTNRGVTPCVRIGRAVRYRVADLEAWIADGCPDEPDSCERLKGSTR
jgi:excisionase family DNA binding protein